MLRIVTSASAAARLDRARQFLQSHPSPAEVVIVGASVLIGRMLSGSPDKPLSRQERITALKASGALRHRKSNQP